MVEKRFKYDLDKEGGVRFRDAKNIDDEVAAEPRIEKIVDEKVRSRVVFIDDHQLDGNVLAGGEVFVMEMLS